MPLPIKKKKTIVSDSEKKKKDLQLKVRDLFREIIGGLSLSQINLPENLTGQERIEFTKFCHQTFHSPFFNQIIEALYYPQIMHIGTKAIDIDEISFNRATANGIMLVAEIFQKWSNVYDLEYSPDQKPKDFDSSKSFEKIN